MTLEPEVRVGILIPTYHNPTTLRDVVERAKATGLEVLVVDDGSTDDTAATLASIPDIVVRSHPKNLGKGAALRTGFALALEHGFTHLITIDSDGQHYPEDVPLLQEALRAHPKALIVGARDLVAAGAGPGSRIGCRFSNLWIHVATGVRLPDTQTGLRVYPLESIKELALRDSRFGFEIEVLVKASWIGVPLVSIPARVHYPDPSERISHYRPLVDFLRIVRMNTRLVFLRICLPAPFLALLCQRSFHDLSLRQRIELGAKSLFFEGHGSPLRIAGSVALGLFMGITPLWGIQIPLTIGLAHAFKASKTIALLAAHISFPLLIPPILYASLVLGRRLLGSPSLTSFDLKGADFWHWVVGSFALATLVSMAGFALTLAIISASRSFARWKTE